MTIILGRIVMNSIRKKYISLFCMVISVVWSVPFLLTNVNSKWSRLIHQNSLLNLVEDSYYNFYSLFLINIFCFFNLLLGTVNCFKSQKERQWNQSSKLFSISYFIVSVIAYTVHFLVFKYFLEGAFAG